MGHGPSDPERRKILGTVWVVCPPPAIAMVIKGHLKEEARVHIGYEAPENETPSSIVCCSGRPEAVASEVKRLRGHAPDAPVLVLGLHDDPQLAREALLAGADGFVHARGMRGAQIIRALAFAAKGEIVLPRELVAHLIEGEGHKAGEGMSDPVNHTPLRWSTVTLAGVGSILIAGLIHLTLAPEHFKEATYLGLLFLADFVGAAAAAFGIFRGQRWGWVLGALVAGVAYVSYIVSGTVGLPGVTPEGLLEPIGVAAKAVEALFLVVCAFVFTGALTATRRWALVIGTAALLLIVVPGLALALSPPYSHEDPDSGHRRKGLVPRFAGPVG